MHSLKFGSPDTTWKVYGLSEHPIIYQHNGETQECPFKAIIRNGSLVNIVGQGYQLLPNEEALKIANEAAKLANLEQFHTIEGRGVHTIFGKNQARMHAFFVPKKTFQIQQEKINVGAEVHNSIDGSTSFGASVFTYRQICANGVIMGKEHVVSISKRHTKSLNPLINDLKGKILLVLDQAKDIITFYRRMADRKATEALVEKIKKTRLPKKILPDYLTAEEPTIKPDALTEWQVYNDITAAIWHNTKAEIKTKTFQFSQLHRAMPIIPR